jgi:F-type H+-transporting ATPase subunit delta
VAEIATVARPYAQAVFEACGDDVAGAQGWLNGLAQIVADSDLLRLASNPKVGSTQVFEVIQGALGGALPTRGVNFLRTVIANGRLAALPEVARQFRALADRVSEITEAVVYTPFPLSVQQLSDLQPALERHFKCKLKLEQKPDASLIGGVRVVAGDEVLDTSVKARLQHMKTVLTSA